MILIFHSSPFFLEIDLNLFGLILIFHSSPFLLDFVWTDFLNAISLVGINYFRLLILIALTLPICCFWFQKY